jgi:hypothetical protein
MPRFTILPKDESISSMELVSDDSASVLHLIGRLPCNAADVLQDGEYAFSLRQAQGGFWEIYQCERAPE